MIALQYIGVDIGGTSIRAARFSGDNHVPTTKTKIPTQAMRGVEAVLQRIEAAIREVAGDQLPQIAGIGMALPGPLDPHTGILIEAPNLPGWENLPLQGMMTKRVGRPVFIGNDANLAALGEWKFGAGRGHDDVLYLTVSTGIGGGGSSNGRTFVGAPGPAAGGGDALAVPDGPPGACR